MSPKLASLTLALLALALPRPAAAHCDTLDGPVVSAARAALEGGKLEPVLAWVMPEAEPEIRDAFTRARAARKAGKEARDVADRWFFETVVRVHRAGEGAPFTGLEPAGGSSDPAITAVDRAIASGDPAKLEALLVGGVREGLHAGYARVRAERPPGDDVVAGRRWVAAYVPFVHWAEAVNAAARAGLEGTGGHAGHDAGKHETASPAPAAARPAEGAPRHAH